MGNVSKGFGSLPCLWCGEECEILLSLSDCDGFRCCECDREFSRSDVQEIVGKWQRVLAWLDGAPKQEG